ncbi:MAG: beta-propeller domain-containing protein [Myxococcales bacterium]|nr:beta-propeller domain-containing protein [Myxococcales bacterium]
MSSHIRPLLLSFVVGLSTVAGFVACKGGSTGIDPDPIPGQTEFESDDPSADAGTPGTTGGADAGSAADTGAAPTSPGDKSGDEAARAIEEADIVKVAGTRLYALSKVGGLSIIDVGTRDKLTFLGRWRSSGQPFEMYVRDDVVLAMVNGWEEWSYDGYKSTSKQTSKVVALDVRDATKIAPIGEFSVPGEVSDSRIVGDVMYVVSHQNGYCWGCDAKPGTFVLSLGVKDPRKIAKVDQVGFTSTTTGYSWWKRSVSATDKRFWIGGPDWAWSAGSKPRSTIQALDVSDPTGKLTLGAAVTLDGQIQSRWQMDELDGVLRVITQPGGWSGAEPVVETFTVKSSSEVLPLGRMTLKLPKPETLMSVRFDGKRGYAITTERKDPLFTIDLSDPSKPVQMGELEMPGWIMYMEPRGNRLLGLGFDNGNPDGAMTVSLFDVSDLKTPKMLKRVNFGKGWASAPEDADRIHKAFRALDAEQLIMVPFSSTDWRMSDGSCRRAESGIQLIDWKDDTLALRGVAPVWGQPRRALLHEGRLFAVSDAQVATYDITDRGAPVGKASLPLANPSHRAVVIGDHVVQMSHDWFTQHAQLVVMPRANVEQAIPVSSIDLGTMLGDASCGYYGWSSWWNARMFVKGTKVIVVVPSYGYGYGKDGGKDSTLVGVIDFADPKKPVLVGKAAIPLGSSGYYYSDYYYYGASGNGVLAAGDAMVLAGDTVVALSSETRWNSATMTYDAPVSRISTIDLRDPTKPAAGTTWTLPAASGYTALQVAGGKVLTSRWMPSGEGKVRFYVDELDVSDPAAPKIGRSINVPGSLLAFDAASSRVLTVDYKRIVTVASDYSDCYAKGTAGDIPLFDWDAKTCVILHRTLRKLSVSGSIATMIESLELPKQRVSLAVVAGPRVLLRSGYDYYGYDGYKTGPVDRAWVVDGLRDGALRSSEIALGSGYGGGMWAAGDRAVLSSDRRLFAVDLAAAKVLRTVQLDGYSYPSHVAVAPDTAYASLGDQGVLAVSLQP